MFIFRIGLIRSEPFYFDLFAHKTTYFDLKWVFGQTPLPNMYLPQALLVAGPPFLLFFRVLSLRMLLSGT